MAISKIFGAKTLVLRLNTGLDEDFNPILKNRSWSAVKSNVTDANLYALATEIGSLQDHTIDEVRTVTTEVLEED